MVPCGLVWRGSSVAANTTRPLLASSRRMSMSASIGGMGMVRSRRSSSCSRPLRVWVSSAGNGAGGIMAVPPGGDRGGGGVGMLAGIGPERPVACYLATAVLTWWNVAQDRSMHIPFDNSYAQLPERFYARLEPTPVAAPALVRVNDRLARLLGLDPDELRSPAGVAVLAGNAVPEGGDPMALAYAGHQFGHFVPQL